MGRLDYKILGVVVAVLLVGCLVAIGVVVTLQRNALYEISEKRTTQTADIIATDLERSMIEGNADVTRAMVSDYGSVDILSRIEVVGETGKVAFGLAGEGLDRKLMASLREGQKTLARRERDEINIYRPLINTRECQGCHDSGKTLLGVISLTIPLDTENASVTRFFVISSVASVIVIAGLSAFMILLLRRVVIRPIKRIEAVTERYARGDFSSHDNLRQNDEVGRLSHAIRESIFSISGILRKINDVSERIAKVSRIVKDESGMVLKGTEVESESVENISSSIEEMNASIVEISEGTDSLAVSIEETAASMEQMSSSIAQITHSTQDLFVAVEETSSSIEEMSTTIGAVAENADKLASSSEDTLSSIEELNFSIKEVDRHAKESSSLSQKVVENATQSGLQSVEKTIEGMRRIEGAVRKAAESIRRLGDRSEEIGKILNVIDEITEQTTLLSLNAAILASQAGEYGKGFSVVADEIKDLAERTSFSTQEISGLVNFVQQEVAESVNAMEEGVRTVEQGFALANSSEDALKKIIESARKSSEMSSAIERATEQQSDAVKVVTESMDKVQNMIASIARATSEQKKGANLIISASEKVRNITTKVRSSSEEQASSTRQISKSMENVTDKTQQISFALREQKEGASNIRNSLEKIRKLPEENRQRAMVLNHSINDLNKDSELLRTELKTFRLAETSFSDVLRFGIVPLESPAAMFSKFTPLAEYLGDQLERKVEIKVASKFAEAVNDISQGDADICFMTPSTYIQAHDRADVQVLVKAIRDGKTSHHSLIIANENSHIEKIEDIKGMRFAFGDVNSTSSTIVPHHLLMKSGVTLESLRDYRHFGTHDEVVEAVLSGEFDAGGVMEKAALKYKGHGLKIIKYSDDIPEFNICVSGNLPDELVGKIRESLLKLNDKEAKDASILREIDKHYNGFTEASDKDYDGIRAIMVELGII